MILNFPHNQKTILALGAEQDTRFVLCKNNQLFFSENNSAVDFEDLQTKILNFLKQHSINKPDIILSDLHPEYISTKTAEILAKEWQIPHFKIQHHYAHFFSAIAEYYFLDKEKTELPEEIIGIICDGTGYGLDDTIWGGEILSVKCHMSHVKSIKRLGCLEPQTLLGGNLAIEEPARMILSILNKFLNQDELYKIMSKFYDEKTFKLLYKQLNKNFNCQETSSCARILDACCALLFDHNKRDFKHQAVKILEQNSDIPYNNIKPSVVESRIKNQESRTYELQTTPLFKYLITNLDQDKPAQCINISLKVYTKSLTKKIFQYFFLVVWPIIKFFTNIFPKKKSS
jgi:hydrogenase maturation protein HypF